MEERAAVYKSLENISFLHFVCITYTEQKKNGNLYLFRLFNE